MAETLRCWRCGVGLEALSLPLSRMDECPECLIHLHTCRMCINFDPVIPRSCREDAAEEVLEKQRANFCDYFQPNPAAFDKDVAAAGHQARKDLDGLFGSSGEEAGDGDAGQPDDSASTAADDLFK